MVRGVPGIRRIVQSPMNPKIDQIGFYRPAVFPLTDIVVRPADRAFRYCNICMNCGFRGHSYGFLPCSGFHFPSIGLNRAGHDTSLTKGEWIPGTILVMMYSQSLQNE